MGTHRKAQKGREINKNWINFLIKKTKVRKASIYILEEASCYIV